MTIGALKRGNIWEDSWVDYLKENRNFIIYEVLFLLAVLMWSA